MKTDGGDILDTIAKATSCLRCKCNFCQKFGHGEPHDHVCRGGPFCAIGEHGAPARLQSAHWLLRNAAEEIRNLRQAVAKAEARAEAEPAPKPADDVPAWFDEN